MSDANRAEKAKQRREDAARNAAKAARKRRLKAILITLLCVALLAGFVFWRISANSRQSAALDKAVTAAGCTKVQESDTTGGGQHLALTDPQPVYDTSPPSHGPHWPSWLTARIYDAPLAENYPDGSGAPTIFEAVHSLEHAYVIVWHNGLSDDQLSDLEGRWEDESKVIVAPYPGLSGGNKIALTAWGFHQECKKPSETVIEAFVDKYRNAKSAPEPNAS